jgi:ABC-2 type transport system ATP-binding protein
VSTPLLTVRDLSFSYPTRHVFTGWSADFAAGLTWVRGANGSGKSTLLQLLAGAMAPTLGQRVAAGIDAAADPIGYRRQVFWCGPGAVPFDHLRPPEYWGFMQGLYPRWRAVELPALVEGLGLRDALLQPLARLSTGTQRKVWLAAALVVASPVVLIDEPLNALDSASLAFVKDRLHDAATRTGQAFVVASHEPPLDGPASMQTPVQRLDLPTYTRAP